MIPIIMVTHNNAHTLSACFRSLAESELPVNDDVEVIVVDNNSSDNTRDIISDWVSRKEIKIKAKFLNQNVGFAKGVIIGLTIAKPKSYFALLNPDALPTRKWLVELLHAMEQDKRVGIAQSLLVHPDLSIDSAGGFLSFLGYPRELKYVVRDKPYEVMYAKGAAALVRVSAYRDAGGFDPRFFFYYDETDLSARMRRKGYKVIVVPRSVVFHIGLGSKIPHKELFVLYYMERNRLLYIYKNDPLKLSLALLQAMLGALKDQGIRREVRLRALKDFLSILKGENVIEPFTIKP